MIRVRISLCTLLTILLGCSSVLAAPPEGKPVLVPMWKKSTVGLLKEEELDDSKYVAQEWLNKFYESVTKEARTRSQALIPPASPRIANGMVFYANDDAIVARSLAGGQAFGEKLAPGELFWHQVRWFGLQSMARELSGRVMIDHWLKRDESTLLSERVLHRTLCHHFAVGQKHAIYIDDIGLLPLKKDTPLSQAGVFTCMLRRNLVSEVELDSGKLSGRAGVALDDQVTSEVYFLSLPIIHPTNRLFVKEQGVSLRLLSLDWDKHKSAYVENWTKKGVADLALAAGRKWEIEIAKPSQGLGSDPHRRIHAIHLIENKGLILCPTHVGRVVAVDSKTGKIQWTHEYAPLDAKRFPTFAPEWVVVPPVVVGDKYIYAPADFPELLCLNVADGKKVWSVKKGDGLYPAVVGDHVLVIGEKTLRSLNLKDGSEQWKLDLPGLPCGRGAMLGDKYLLPCSEPKTWKGLIAIVDLKAGKILEVLKPEKAEPIGNLVVHQEFLISQTLTEIAVFPIRK